MKVLSDMARVLRGAATAAGVLAVLWIWQAESLAQVPKGKIAGTVIDAETKQGLPGG